MKRKASKADEFDVVTKWRRIFHWRPGEVSLIKRRMRRRERHDAKREMGKDE